MFASLIPTFPLAFCLKIKQNAKCLIHCGCCCALQASLFCCDWMMLRLNDLWESRVFSVSMELTYIASVRAEHTKKRLKLWLHVNKSLVCHLCHYTAMHFSYEATSSCSGELNRSCSAPLYFGFVAEIPWVQLQTAFWSSLKDPI